MEKTFTEWLTEVDVIKKYTSDRNLIPPMVNPLGRHWSQPKVSEIKVLNDKECEMSQKAFNELSDYTASQPSGVYAGKMWKAQKMKEGTPLRGRTLLAQLEPEELEWHLCWFSYHGDPNVCTNNQRRIIIK